MAQACATFGFNPGLVPSPPRVNKQATSQGSPAQGSVSSASSPVPVYPSGSSFVPGSALLPGSASVRTSTSSRSTWETLITECHYEDNAPWDLERIDVLRKTLRDWVLMDVPLSKLGKYIEFVLYKHDDHMNGRVTDMVNKNVRHVCIALEVLKYYQIRDEQQNPLWFPDGHSFGDWHSLSGDLTESSTETQSERHVHFVPDDASEGPGSAAGYPVTDHSDFDFGFDRDSSHLSDEIPISEDTRIAGEFIVPEYLGPNGPFSLAERRALGFDTTPPRPPTRRGPSLLMYHHANPRMGRRRDANGNVVLDEPSPLWI